MKSKYLKFAVRMKQYGFSTQVLHKDAVVVERYAMDGYLHHTIQVNEQERKKSKVQLSVGVSVLDLIGINNPLKASTNDLVEREIDRYGRLEWPGDRFHDYEGWDYNEIDAIGDVAISAALPWLDSWTDPHRIIQFVLDDIKQRDAARAEWDKRAAEPPTLWQRLRGQRPLDPSSRPKGTPPSHHIKLANLYRYIGDKAEAAKHLEQVCAIYPLWTEHRAALERLRKG